MTTDWSALWRNLSESFGPWAATAFGASAIVGEGLHQLCVLFEPHLNYTAVTQVGWTIFGLFVSVPVAGMWHVVKHLFGMRTAYDRAREHAVLLRMAMKEAGLTATEQKAEWKAFYARIQTDFWASIDEPPPDTMLKAHRSFLDRDISAPEQ